MSYSVKSIIDGHKSIKLRDYKLELHNTFHHNHHFSFNMCNTAIMKDVWDIIAGWLQPFRANVFKVSLPKTLLAIYTSYYCFSMMSRKCLIFLFCFCRYTVYISGCDHGKEKWWKYGWTCCLWSSQQFYVFFFSSPYKTQIIRWIDT